MGHAWEKRENYTRFWWERLKDRNHSEDRGTDGRMGIRMDLTEIGLGGGGGFGVDSICSG
jgi:hypothetical protein